MQRRNLTLIHGFMGDPSDWDEVREELSADYEICTPLIRPAEDWDASIEQLIADLPKRSVIVGYSMGARLALSIAIEHPERCDALVFVSGNPGLETEEQRKQRFAHDGKIAERIESEPREQFLDYWYTARVFESLTDEVRADEIRRKSTRASDDWASILKANTVAKQPNYWSRADELSMPTLAIAGISDHKYVDIMVRLGREVNSNQLETRIVPDCGHIVHREQPRVFLKLLRDFLDATASENQNSGNAQRQLF